MGGTIQSIPISQVWCTHQCGKVNSVEAIKYLYKYNTKGNDKFTLTVESEDGQEQAVHDEIETILHARYISASEAYW